MILLDKRNHKRMLQIHGWSGILLGLLLFVIVATGTVAVLAKEIGIWSSGNLVARSPLTRPLDATMKRLLQIVSPTLRDRIDLSVSRANQLQIEMRGAPGSEERGIRYEIATDGTEISRIEGYTRDIDEADPAGALANFLVGVHVRLYVPEPWGYILTGVAGLAMLVAAISGFCIHRHLLADIFTLRSSTRPVLAQRDRHSVAAAWALPFVFVLALTGSFLSFAGSIGIPSLAWVAFGGDQEALIAVLIGSSVQKDSSPHIGADLDGIIADAMQQTGSQPDFIEISHPGRADATVAVTLETERGDLGARTLLFNGADGRFLKEKPGIGRVPSIGGATFSLMGPLHFGAFAGMLSKTIWVVLGYATCFVIITGIRLWLLRRDLSLAGWSALDRATSITAYGLPLSIATAAMGFFASFANGTTIFWTGAGFVIGAVAAMLIGCTIARAQVEPFLRLCVGVSLCLLPLLRLTSNGPSWYECLKEYQFVIPFGDIVAIFIGIIFVLPVRHQWFELNEVRLQTSGPRET